MKIAVTGVRGVPAVYGGPETCAEQVSVRLAARGHEVTAYCRPGFHDAAASEYKGVRRVTLPTIRITATDTYLHTLLSLLHMIPRRPDAVMIFNPGVGGLCAIPRLFGTAVLLNPDGFDWRRAKWGPFAKWFIKTNARFGARFSSQLITDSVTVRDYYNADWGCSPEARYVPYGASTLDHEDPDPTGTLARYGVETKKYFFFLSRHVPENSCTEILDAFSELDTDFKLLFGGGGDTAYAEGLRERANEAILMPGVIQSEEDVATLHRHAYAIVHGNQPGGTSLGLLKGMGYARAVATPNTPDNAFVVGETGYPYEVRAEAIRSVFQQMLADPEEVERRGAAARRRIDEHYNWEAVVDEYEAILTDIVR